MSANEASFAKSEAALHEEAMRETGLEDFGDPAYLEGLRRVLDGYDCEAKLHEQGRMITRMAITGLLRTRLRSQALLRAHAAAQNDEIRRPIVVLGLVRTGSTSLHHLLGQDPHVNVLEYWLAAHPQPRPPRATWEALPEYQESHAEIEGMYAMDPELRAIHFMRADLAEECRHLLAQSFTDDYFEVNTTLPSYVRWYENTRHPASYRRHRELVKLIGSASPEKRWILKYPVHLKHLADLLEVYPDACVVWTHRDPSKVLASYIDLIAGFRALFERDIDRAAIAREQVEAWASGAERAIEVRKQHDPSQFLDLDFGDSVADPIAAVRRIYDRFDLVLTEDAEKRMRAWMEETPEGKRGRQHTMEDVGLSRAQVLDRFGAYMRHFGLQAEPLRAQRAT
jgi:hypothetical protein